MNRLKKYLLYTGLLLIMGGYVQGNFSAPIGLETVWANAVTKGDNKETAKQLIDNCVLVPYTKQDGTVYLMNDCLRPKNAPDPIGKDAYTADPSGAGGVRTLLALTTGGIIAIGGVVAILAVIYSGFLMVTSGGDEGKREEAIKYLTWSIVGLLIMIFSYIIVKNIIDVIGIAATFMPG